MSFTPCKVEGAATEKADEHPLASMAEVTAAIEVAPDRWRLAILLAVWCQLRRSEVLGLQRRDIDLLHAVLSVERGCVVVLGNRTIGPPKTEEGKRKTGIPEHVVSVLEHHLVTYVQGSKSAWLFPGADGGPMHPRSLDHMWAKVRRTIGRSDLHFHDLRHSGLTWVAATGASTREIMRRGGHASPQAALRYQHATDDRYRVLTGALTKLAEGADIVSIKPAADNLRTRGTDERQAPPQKEAPTSNDEEQSQRGSNPCLHLERVVS
jgi:integrase